MMVAAQHLLQQHCEGVEDVGLYRLLTLSEAASQRRRCLQVVRLVKGHSHSHSHSRSSE